MTTEHRKSPKRAVVEIRKIGSWGNIGYHHHLECGHVEVRPRASKAPKLACVWCKRSAEKAKEIAEYAPKPSFVLPSDDHFDDTFSTGEVEVARIRAELAKIVGIPLEAVDVSVHWPSGSPKVQGAVLFLSAGDVERLTRRGSV